MHQVTPSETTAARMLTIDLMATKRPCVRHQADVNDIEMRDRGEDANPDLSEFGGARQPM
jgi:hypothetical protein